MNNISYDNPEYEHSGAPYSNIHSDSLDKASDQNSEIDKTHNCGSLIPMQEMQRNIKISRNPPPLTKEAWELIDTEFTQLNKTSWDRLENEQEEPEIYISNLN